MLSDRLIQLVEYKGISSRAFALKINVSSQSFGKYLQGREPSASVLSCIIETFDDINPDWLLTGRGEMLKGGGNNMEDLTLSQQRTIENLSETIKNLTSK